MNKTKGLLIAAVALVVLALGGTWLYINVIKEDAPKALTIDDAQSSSSKSTTTAAGDAPTGTPANLDGEWTVQSGSTVGYRVKEVLFGQDTEGVGRTEKVTGSLTLAGPSITDATFTVDVASMKSDEAKRDAQFSGRIMDTATNPTAEFNLTEPIVLDAIPANSTEIETTATGELTLRGTTLPVELKLTAKLDGSTIKVAGTYDVVFEDWMIPNPSIGPITTEDHGLLEFALAFGK